jgi:hypothetical protein
MRLMVVAMVLSVGLSMGGCFSPASYLNPDFLSALGAGSQVASIPGDAPALLVSLENRTDRMVRAMLSYRLPDVGVETVTYTIAAGESTAQALICPVEEITLGDVSDANVIGAEIVLDTGVGYEALAPVIEVEPFGVVMKDGVNYDCGDAIQFTVQASGVTRSGYQIFAYIQRTGDNP